MHGISRNLPDSHSTKSPSADSFSEATETFNNSQAKAPGKPTFTPIKPAASFSTFLPQAFLPEIKSMSQSPMKHDNHSPISIKALVDIQKKVHTLTEVYKKKKSTILKRSVPVENKLHAAPPKKIAKTTLELPKAKLVVVPSPPQHLLNLPPKPPAAPSPVKPEYVAKAPKLCDLKEVEDTTPKKSPEITPFPKKRNTITHKKWATSAKQDMDQWGHMNTKIAEILSGEPKAPTEAEYRPNVETNVRQVMMLVKWAHPKYLNEKPKAVGRKKTGITHRKVMLLN